MRKLDTIAAIAFFAILPFAPEGLLMTFEGTFLVLWLKSKHYI